MAELWSPTRIAQEFGMTRPSAARTWLCRQKPRIPVAGHRIDRGHVTYLYDSALVLAAREQR